MGKIALKHVLKNFLNHFETLESRRKLNHEDDLYLKEFQSLKELTETLKKDPDYNCSKGLEVVNRVKNRYKDILPYDYSRVILSDYPGVPGSDYINANYVKGSTGSTCAYIASQGPLPNTVVDFWRMIWECEVTVIVMACNETESEKYKCENYWAQTTDQELQYGNITVSLIKWKQVCLDFLVRTFKIKSNNEERIVCQFHYTTWPDHGVPNSVKPILELVRLIRDVQASEARPILVHCSAGCGRTGTICSIDYVCALLRTGKLKEDFSLYTIISDMRRQRIAMVQTQEQYVLCYRAVATLFEQQLKMIDAHTYENLNEDGEPLVNSSDEENDENHKNYLNKSVSESSNTETEIFKSSFTKNKKNTFGLLKQSRLHKSSPNFEIESFQSATSIPTNNTDQETKHEKLVGKATVIRRPSIAHLKAMFENMTTNTDYNLKYRNKKPLQRSMSTREKVGFNNEWTYNFSQHGSFENLSFYNDNNWNYNRSKSFLNDIDFHSNSNNVCYKTDDSASDYPSLENSSLPISENEKIYDFSSNLKTVNNKNVTTFNDECDNLNEENNEQPPPKPPRTYQYGLKSLNDKNQKNETHNKEEKIKHKKTYPFNINSQNKHYNTISSFRYENKPFSYLKNDVGISFLKSKTHSQGQSKSVYNIAEANLNNNKPFEPFEPNIGRSMSITLYPTNDQSNRSNNNYLFEQNQENDLVNFKSSSTYDANSHLNQLDYSGNNIIPSKISINEYQTKNKVNDYYGYIGINRDLIHNNGKLYLKSSIPINIAIENTNVPYQLNVSNLSNPVLINQYNNQISSQSFSGQSLKSRVDAPFKNNINMQASKIPPMSYVKPMRNTNNIYSISQQPQSQKNYNTNSHLTNSIPLNVNTQYNMFSNKLTNSAIPIANQKNFSQIQKAAPVPHISHTISYSNEKSAQLKKNKIIQYGINIKEDEQNTTNKELYVKNINIKNSKNQTNSKENKESLDKSQFEKDQNVKKEKCKKSNGTFYAFSTLFGLKRKKEARKLNTSNNLTTNNSGAISTLPTNNVPNNNNNLIRPPHSHRFSPPAQWTQV